MKKITEKDLKNLQTALLKDYGFDLKGKDLYAAAFSLLSFFEALIIFNKKDKPKPKGSKAIQVNPLKKDI